MCIATFWDPCAQKKLAAARVDGYCNGDTTHSCDDGAMCFKQLKLNVHLSIKLHGWGYLKSADNTKTVDWLLHVIIELQVNNV